MDWKKIFKIITGILVIPIGITASKLWPWWQKQSLPVQIISGFVVLPFMIIAGPLSKWWDNF